jgi:hypothetical protein
LFSSLDTYGRGSVSNRLANIHYRELIKVVGEEYGAHDAVYSAKAAITKVLDALQGTRILRQNNDTPDADGQGKLDSTTQKKRNFTALDDADRRRKVARDLKYWGQQKLKSSQDTPPSALAESENQKKSAKKRKSIETPNERTPLPPPPPSSTRREATPEGATRKNPVRAARYSVQSVRCDLGESDEDHDVPTHAARATKTQNNNSPTHHEPPICQAIKKEDVEQDEEKVIRVVVINVDEELEPDGAASSEPEAAFSPRPQHVDDVTKYAQEVEELEQMLQKAKKKQHLALLRKEVVELERDLA